MLKRLWMLALCVAPVAAWSGTAIVATDEKCDEGTTERFTKALRESLERRPTVELLTEMDTQERLGGVARGALGDVERQISGSRTDFYQGNLARAERTLLSALADLYRQPPSQDRWNDISEAITLLTQVMLKDGRDDEAARSAKLLLRVDPKYTPNQDLFPPSLRDFFDQVRRSTQVDRTEELVVTTRPSGVLVYVGGRPVGKAPLKLRLSPGTYRIEAAFEGGPGIGRTVKAGETAIVELDAQFEGAIYVDRGPCLRTYGSREERLVALVRMATLLGVDQLISVRVEEPAGGERYLVASLVDRASGEEAREAKVKIYAGAFATGALDRLADFLTTGEAAPPVQPIRGEKEKAPVVVETPEVKPAPDEPRRPRIEPTTDTSPTLTTVETKPVVRERSHVPSYVAFGVGAALLAGSGAFAYQADGTNTELEGLRSGGVFPADSVQRVTELDGQLGRQRTTAVGLAAAGVGALITGGVMWLMNGEEEAK